jgi:vacuolar-type H+-ATPase subunit D/Vma8
LLRLSALQHTRDIQRELSLARLENDQLRLDGLRQRKQNSILRLKLASAKEDVDLLQRNIALLNQHSQRLVDETVDLRDTVSNAQQQLTAVSAAKAVLQAEASKQQVTTHTCMAGTTVQDPAGHMAASLHAPKLHARFAE